MDVKQEDQVAPLGQVRALFTCQEKGSTDYGNFRQNRVKFGAAYGKEGENKDYSDATPSGEIWMNISEGRPAFEFFKAGKQYYVTFTEVPAKQ